MPRFASLTFCFILLLPTGCASMAAKPAADEGVRIWHVVIIHLINPGDSDAQQRLVDASKTFGAIPGVRVVHVGRVLPGNRPHQDSSFDIGLAMGFASKEDLAAYVTHPTHVKAVNEVLKPLARDYTSYDFTNE